MKKFNRFLYHVAFNAFVIGLTWSAVFGPLADNPGIRRFAVFAIQGISFLSWATCATCLAAAAFPKSYKSSIKKEKPWFPVPVWVDFIEDIAVVFMCVYAGWMWSAALFFIAIFANQIARHASIDAWEQLYDPVHTGTAEKTE